MKTASLGLGAMGVRMSARILEKGHELTVWNRTRERADALDGVRVAATPTEAVAGAEIVISCLTDDDAARAVWLGDDGAAAAMDAGAIAVEASTVTPAWIAELAPKVGGTLIEGPVVGSRPQADAAKLITLAGGDADAVERARPVLEAYSGRVQHMGALGLGAFTKLVVNTFYASQVAASREAFQAFRAAGVDDERWIDLFFALPVVSERIAGGMKAMAEGTHDPLFPVALVEKDLRYMRGVAEEKGVDDPVGAAAHDVYRRAVDAGLGGLNMTGIGEL